jgi:translation initiation factor IF-2
MEKIRVYELAKELNTNSKNLMDKLKAININVKNHMSLLEEDELRTIYKYFNLSYFKNKKRFKLRKKIK